MAVDITHILSFEKGNAKDYLTEKGVLVSEYSVVSKRTGRKHSFDYAIKLAEDKFEPVYFQKEHPNEVMWFTRWIEDCRPSDLITRLYPELKLNLVVYADADKIEEGYYINRKYTQTWNEAMDDTF